MKKTSVSQSSGAADTAAPEEKKLFRRSIGPLRLLARRGVAPGDAIAVAFNATFLFYNLPHSKFMLSPKSILRKYSYAEIASLCEHLLGIAEFAVNTSYNAGEYERRPKYSLARPQSKGDMT